MHSLKVELGDRSYPILIEPGLLDKIGELCRLYRIGARFVMITNPQVDSRYGDQVAAGFAKARLPLHRITVPEGERHKSLESLDLIIGEMLQLNCDRQTVVLALGGGVIGDLAGFAAAAFMRGVPFIQVPTTLLSQIDASVGGKVAVNHRLGKNMIGAFHQPRMVIIDPKSLFTLPPREVICGLAEMVKHAFIRDAVYLDTIERSLDNIIALEPETLSAAILRSCEIKAGIVSQDERESGVRSLLNFGHTIGHALEAVCGYETLRHGEAVLLGMLAEAYISMKTQRLVESDFRRVENFLRRIPLKTQIARISMEELERFMTRDKKGMDGAVRLVLLRSIGEAELSSDWQPGWLHEAIGYAVDAFQNARS